MFELSVELRVLLLDRSEPKLSFPCERTLERVLCHHGDYLDVLALQAESALVIRAPYPVYLQDRVARVALHVVW